MCIFAYHKNTRTFLSICNKFLFRVDYFKNMIMFETYFKPKKTNKGIQIDLTIAFY